MSFIWVTTGGEISPLTNSVNLNRGPLTYYIRQFCVDDDDDDDQFIYINRYLRQLMWIKLSDWNPLLLISKICKERRIENLISKLSHYNSFIT